MYSYRHADPTHSARKHLVLEVDGAATGATCGRYLHKEEEMSGVEDRTPTVGCVIP